MERQRETLEAVENPEDTPVAIPRKIEGVPPRSLGSISDNASKTADGTPKNAKGSSTFGSDSFLTKLDIKICEHQILHGNLVKEKFEAVKVDIRDYFSKLGEQVQKRLIETRDSVLAKIETIIEKEGGYVDWDKFRDELLRKKEEYEKAPDIITQKQAFDEYFDYYNATSLKIDAINSKSYTKLDKTSKIFRFDDIVIDKFMINLHSLCLILESDFVSSVSFLHGQIDPIKMRLDEILQVPHPGVSCSPEKIEEYDTFVLAGHDGRISLYDAKSLRVLDVIQALNDTINCLLYISQHNILLIGGTESKVMSRRIEGRNLGKYLSHLDAGGSVSFLLFLDDQNLIASVGSDTNVRLFNPNSLVMISKIPIARKGSTVKGGAHYFKDKKLLALGFDDGTLQFYSMKTKQLAFGVFTESKTSLSLVFNEATARLFAHTQPGILKVWKFKGDRPVDETNINLEEEGDKACDIRLIGKFLVLANNSEKVLIYDIDENKAIKKVEIPGFKAQGLLVLEKEGKFMVTDDNNSKAACIKFH